MIPMGIFSSLRSVPGLVPAWSFLKKIPLFSKLKDDLQLYSQYKKWRPDSVKLPNSDQIIFVDPLEKRGLSLLKGNAQGQPFIKKFWKSVCDEVQPTIVLDVGLNYGEIVFAERYLPSSSILGIEANSNLLKWLERSRQSHPNRDQITIVNALAGEKSDGEQSFFVNEKWSGSSSATLDPNMPGVKEQRVPCVSIDSLLEQRFALSTGDERMIFKIDVEGYEPHVLRGMRESFRRVTRWAGIIEFSEEFFPKLGIKVEDYLAEILEIASIVAMDHHGTLHPLATSRITDWHAVLGEQPISADLILISHGSELSFLKQWKHTSANRQGSSV
jgi:FkbM family methyltransferase